MGDIVDQMTREMNLTPQMLDNMQQQHTMQTGGQSNFNGGYMQQPAMMPPQYPPQGVQPQYQPPPQAPMPQQPAYDSETETESSVSSSSIDSDDMNLDKLGLTGRSGGFADGLFNYLKDPVVVIVLFVILNLTQFDSVLKPLLPAVVATGIFYIGVKAGICGLIFGLLKLVII